MQTHQVQDLKVELQSAESSRTLHLADTFEMLLKETHTSLQATEGKAISLFWPYMDINLN